MARTRGLGRLCGLVALLAASLALAIGPNARAGDGVPGQVVLAGIVVDEAGKPIDGVVVSARTWPASEPVKTGEGGGFRLSLPSSPWGRIYATLVARGGDDRLGVLLVSREETNAEPVRVVVKPARALDVRVVDREGKPVAGADVHFLENLRQIVAGRTDFQGRWIAKVPADAKNWGVYALRSNTGFDYALAERARGSTEPLRPLPERLTFTLDGVRPPLRVEALGRDGKPIPGVKVGPWLIRKPGREAEMNGMTDTFIATDDRGIATFDWLPARIEGMLSIVSDSSDYYAPDHATWLPADRPVDDATITFFPYERLSGRVTMADGRPAAEVTLTIQGQGAGDNGFHGRARTDADGRYTLRVHSEQAYIIAASKGDLAAPYRAGVVVRAGKPVAGVDLVLGRGTRVKGRVTVGKDKAPAGKVNVAAVIDKGSIPAELRREGDRYYREMSLYFWNETDKDGRFEFLLGPGEYRIQGPPRVDPVKLTIPDRDPPLEIVRDFSMPRPESGPFTATVVDVDGKPVAGALVDGAYQSMTGLFNATRTDARGTIRIRRSLDPLVLVARSPDGSRAGAARVDADATEARIVLRPTATASGRLTDADGRAIAGRKLISGVRIHLGPGRNSPFSWHFGDATTTDADGGFRLAGLVVGETYEIHIDDDDGRRMHTARTRITPTDPNLIALGDVPIDTRPPRPYVPPTPAQRTGESFAARKEKTPRERLAYVLDEARREYTRPLLLFGGPADPSCVDLFRLFEEQPGREPSPSEPRVKSPADLRWEFELASLDAARPDVRALAKDLGVPIGDGEPPRLAVLSDEGKLLATYALRLGGAGKLDARPLGAFLLEHRLPTRDAEVLLAEGLAKAKAHGRRVFLIMSASWCGPCRMLARFLDANQAELGRHYVFVTLDISRDAHAQVLRERYEDKDAVNGVPWYVILDDAGKPLITSNAKELAEDYGSTSVGFPSSKEGIDHFVRMLKQTAPRLSDGALAALRRALEKKP